MNYAELWDKSGGMDMWEIGWDGWMQSQHGVWEVVVTMEEARNFYAMAMEFVLEY